MSDRYVEDNEMAVELDAFCQRHGLLSPVIVTNDLTDDFGYMTTIKISKVDTNQLVVNESCLGATADESRQLAIHQVITKYSNNTRVDLIGCPDTAAAIDTKSVEPVNGQPVAPIATDKPAKVTAKPVLNKSPLMILSEMCTRERYPLPLYKMLDVTGQPHEPTFKFECELDTGDVKLVATGIGPNKQMARTNSAQDMLCKLQVMPNTGQAFKCEPKLVIDLSAYFRTVVPQFKISFNEVFIDESLDYCQKLDKIATIMSLSLDYNQSIIDNQYNVILKVVINQLSYTLITTNGLSAQSANHCRIIAAKKAIYMLKILLMDDN